MTISEVLQEVKELTRIYESLQSPVSKSITISEAYSIFNEAYTMCKHILDFIKSDQKLIESLYQVGELKKVFNDDELQTLYDIYPVYIECCNCRDRGVYNKELEKRVESAGLVVSEEGKQQLDDIYVALEYANIQNECAEIINLSAPILKELRLSIKQAEKEQARCKEADRRKEFEQQREKVVAQSKERNTDRRTFVKSVRPDVSAVLFFN